MCQSLSRPSEIINKTVSLKLLNLHSILLLLEKPWHLMSGTGACTNANVRASWIFRATREVVHNTWPPH